MNCIRPLASWLGAAGLLLLGACGGGGSSTPNQAPRITGLEAVTVSANESSMAISFGVQDDGDPNRVTLSASSSNPELLSDDDVRFSGGGSNRSLTVTPRPGALGNARVTVVATDPGGLQGSSAFEVNVVAQNVSFRSFFRESFGEPENNEPRDLNSRTFEQDADEDEFDDLLGAP